MPYLVVHDVDAIQSYVFATSQLKEIRGASALVDSLNRENTKELAGKHSGKVIYANGGGAAVIFDDGDSAHAFCQKVAGMFREGTFTASSTGIVHEYEKTDKFGDVLQDAHEKLRQAKAGQARSAQTLTSAFFKRCDSCGTHPASSQAPHEPEDLICQSCRIKQKTDDNVIHPVHDHILKFIKNQCQLDARFPDQLDEIGNDASPQGYIGVIYADANRMGDLLMTLKSEDDLENFSAAVDSAITDSITKTLWERCKGIITEKKIIPAQVPLCGGDDLVVIVRGEDAFEVALDYMENFQDQLEKDEDLTRILGGQKITCCAGVAIAKSHTPLSRLVSLAHELCKMAKARSYTLYQESNDKPCVNFQVITTPNWSDPYETYEGPEYTQGSNRFTARPYTVEEAKSLAASVRLLKKENFPRSKLHSLYRSMRLGTNKARLDYITSYVRAKKEQQDALIGVEKNLGINSEYDAPWQSRTDSASSGMQSPYGDLMEIYPFIAEKKEDA